MDPPEDFTVTHKSWDHPWTTDEMRQHRDNWSLAADAGLLKHLQQFSDNLTERVEKTQDKLSSLTAELNEASVVIDNVTNASLALANTQFIESRVYEDDAEINRSTKDSEMNKEELDKEDVIACVSESIKRGLSVMDEKFESLQVLVSDSEDEGDVPMPRVVLAPKDPYQNRPLPYVIGTEKWKASSKIGLESSSSDSEPPEDDEDSASENEIRQSTARSNNHRESLLRRSSSSSSSSELSGRRERTNNVKDYSSLSSRTDKLEARSQDTLNSGSDIATPTVLQPRAENSGKGAPSFAEELAKRLGNVSPTNRPIKNNQEADQSSINRFKDDLFSPDGNNVFDSNPENLFSDGNNLFDDDVSNSLWKDKPYRAPRTNIIPPSLDVPPPMHTEATKPKSAFDDLCGDAESEDSDSIFTFKSSIKSNPRKSTSASDDKREDDESRENKFLNVIHGDTAANMATSTPENNDNGGLFGDENDYEDDDVLFGVSTISRDRITERSPEVSRATSRTTPPGLSITQADILSSNLGSRLFQRVPRQGSSDSSDTEASMQNPDYRGNERIVPESDSSGISVRPNSTINTFGPGVDFQPESESTRLRSEEIYRERIASDSLFDGRTGQPEITNSTNNSSIRPHEARITETLDSRREEDFDNDDVFGPPPLPKPNDSKSKSEVTSNDDLFSNSSSESRSHKSFDLLATSESQYDVKITSDRSRGLFDEEVDIFGHGDAPDVDIFGEAFVSSRLSTKESVERSNSKIQPDSSGTSAGNNSDLFDPKTKEVIKSSLPSSDLTKSFLKNNSIFDDSEDEDDLFGTNFLKNDRKPPAAMLTSEDDEISVNTSKTTVSAALTETKKDFGGVLVRENVANESITRHELTKRDSNEKIIERALPSYKTGGLFDNLDDKNIDDDDSLFESKSFRLRREKQESEIADKELFVADKASEISKNEESEFKTNCAKIAELLKEQNLGETSVKKFATRENEAGESDVSVSKKPPETSPMKKNSTSSLRESPKDSRYDDVTTTDGGNVSKAQSTTKIISESARREPPKTLSIRLPVPSVTDDSSQAPRRAVSGKIKNLMGKMGDLKILSPTDTPPLWRKTEEKMDHDYERSESKDSEDGSSMSAQNTKSPTIIANKIEDTDLFEEVTKEPAPNSPLDDPVNSETAVSFDLPAQVEVLAVTASKSRARIQAKRRPQSRHARQSALRKSGIDFDMVDNPGIETVESDPSDNTFSGISEKIPTVLTDPIDTDKTSVDRLDGRAVEAGKNSADKITETSSSLAPEDRSELSFSKGSSLSLNKNTLLSPSTDEEDLFDVPPDLPEDPQKEDTLFGRAPILSPIDRLLGSKNTRLNNRTRDTVVSAIDDTVSVDNVLKTFDNDESSKEKPMEKNTREINTSESCVEEKLNVEKTMKDASSAKKPIDPLRDNNHDPLKDPSQLFAFVTKTPSPEKGQNVLFNEDASLFSHVAKKSEEEATAALKKPVLDLFADDSTGDLFSGSFAKSTKKSTKSTKSNSLFDDIDTDEDSTTDLFGTRPKVTREKIDTTDESVASKSSETSGRASPSRSSLFANDDNDNDNDLFVTAVDKKYAPEREKIVGDATENRLFSANSKITKDTRVSDIFGDQSSGEEDLFAKSKTIGTGKVVGATGSLFSVDNDDDDVNDIFGTKATTKGTKIGTIEHRSSGKKTATRDLKKTAETIVEDPLSMLQDDC